jgi:hypothetical protein
MRIRGCLQNEEEKKIGNLENTKEFLVSRQNSSGEARQVRVISIQDSSVTNIFIADADPLQKPSSSHITHHGIPSGPLFSLLWDFGLLSSFFALLLAPSLTIIIIVSTCLVSVIDSHLFLSQLLQRSLPRDLFLALTKLIRLSCAGKSHTYY